MSGRDAEAVQALNMKEWGLILMALKAYQHHAAYRDLHEKLALLAPAVDLSSLAAAAVIPLAQGPRRAERLGRAAGVAA